MPVSNRISARAREQVARQIRYFLEDFPSTTSVPQNAYCLWVDDFDGGRAQMYRLVAEALAPHGWKLRTLKGVKTLVKVP